MRAGGVPVRDVEAEGCRLTGGFHLSEDQIAVSTLRAFPGPTSRVSELVHDRGVFRGPIFKRVYVEDPALGKPYVSARDLVMADVRPSSFLSRRLGGLIENLQLKAGMILVTCSGMNLGAAIWTREDLDGLVASHDLIRVCPDPALVPPGYLYAFLASRYGRAMIRKQIYGGNIKHVEPQHIESLPVPRFLVGLEDSIAARILEAGAARSQAVALESVSRRHLMERLHLTDRSKDATSTNFATFSVPSQELGRLDAPYFAPACRESVAEFASSQVATRQLSEVARVFTPGIFKRQHVDGPEFGYPYYSGSELFKIDPEPRGYLSRKWAGIEEYRVRTNWLLVQDAGQLGGLIGRLVRAPEEVDGAVVSNHLMRIAATSREDSAFLFCVLSSPQGYRAITRNAFGSSIPQLEPSHIERIKIPWPSDSDRAAIAAPVLHAWNLEDSAARSEREAIALVERAIEAAT